MKYIFIVYLFGVIIIDILLYELGQTLDCLTKSRTRTALFSGWRYFIKCIAISSIGKNRLATSLVKYFAADGRQGC
jgi:hypothetical protein